MIKEKKQHNRGIYIFLSNWNEIVLHMMIVIITLHWTTMLSQSEALFLWPSLEPNQSRVPHKRLIPNINSIKDDVRLV